MLAFERAVVRARANGEPSTVHFEHDPGELFEEISAGRVPTAPRRGAFEITIAA